MIYDEIQLRVTIRPMVLTAMQMDGTPEQRAERLTEALIKFIAQDRQAHETQ